MAQAFSEELAAARAQAAEQHEALLALDIAPGRKAPDQRAILMAEAVPLPEQDAEPSGDPAWWSLTQIAAAYRTGLTTSAALVDRLIERIDRIDPELNAFIHLDRAGARAAARDPALPRGALYGIPVAIKDVIDVAGMATTCHSRLRLGAMARHDAAVVAQLRAQGAIVLGKLATHEFAIGGPAFDLPFPPARNPWNRNHHPGGSTSGAGAAVAAGMVPLAIGTDTAGSVRNPASACGIVGLKPTRGLLSCEGVVPLATSLDHVGLLTRNIADARIALAALVPVARAKAAPRIGFVRHFHEIDMRADPEVCIALDRVAQALGAEDVRLPRLDDFALANKVILQCEGARYHEAELRTRPDGFSWRTRAALLPGLFASRADEALARAAQSQFSQAIAALFGDYDVLITASSMTPACRIDDDAAIDATYMRQARTPFNLSGHPALAMMAGLSSQGLPLSVQFAADHGQEATLLAVAERWEGALGGPRRPPV